MTTIKEMLSSLVDSGWSQTSLARQLGTTQSTIHRCIEKNQDPSYELGKKIEALYIAELSEKAA